MSDSLWGEEFEIPNSLEQTQKILKKIRSPKKQKTNLSVNVEKQLSSSSLSIEERLAIIKTNVYKILGKQKNNVVVIKTKQDFDAYIDKAIQAGIVALDTETNNTLDYLTCKIMGACLYVPNEKQAYVPINHVNYKTGEKLSWQLTEQDVKYEIQRLIDAKVKIIFHNYKFDYQVIKETCGIETPAYWDTIIAIKMIDERDGDETSLKKYYTKHIDRKQKKYDIESLFDAKNIQYAYVDPEIFALYAATDSLMTYKCYLYQLSIFSYPKLAGMYKVFMNIEMPIIKVVADMEIAGIAVDFDYIKRVSAKYHALYDGLTQQVNDEMTKLLPAIEAWKATPEAKEQPKIYATERDLKKKNINERFNYEDKFGKYRLGKSKAEQLDSPISLTSPKQLAILVYDILKLPEGEDYNNPRSTESEILENLAKTHDFKLGKLLSQQKEYYTLLSRYIDKVPELVSKKDNRLHTQFNQLGAETGRFSSGNKQKIGPETMNLQNIPSHNKDIRPMFTSSKGMSLVLSDMSACEVRTCASTSKDPIMIQAYKDGKDLYSIIASMTFNKPYSQCLEFYPEGTIINFEGKDIVCGNKTNTNKDGKARRTIAKRVLIGNIYGRGPKSIAEQTGQTVDEAKETIAKFFVNFPRTKEWMEQSRQKSHQLGYVEDMFGRKRHLADIQLPHYSYRYIDAKSNKEINPLLNCSSVSVSPEIINKYNKELEGIKYRKEFNEIASKAKQDRIDILDNTSKIAEGERQCVNFQCQAAGASLIKLDMIAMANDKRLKELGFQLLLTIHDEVVGQCPTENLDEVKQIVNSIMTHSGDGILNVPMVCDTSDEPSGHWYMSEEETAINDTFNKLKDSGKSPEDAYAEVCKEFPELLPDNIYNNLFKGEYLR